MYIQSDSWLTDITEGDDFLCLWYFVFDYGLLGNYGRLKLRIHVKGKGKGQAITLQTWTGRWPATSWVHYTTSSNTQSSAPEDGQNNCPKHVELTGIINKPLLLYLVGCLYYLYFIIFFWNLLNNLNLFIYRMSCIS